MQTTDGVGVRPISVTYTYNKSISRQLFKSILGRIEFLL